MRSMLRVIPVVLAHDTSASRLATPSGAKIAGVSAGLAASPTRSVPVSVPTRPRQKLAAPSCTSGCAFAYAVQAASVRP